MSTFRRRKRKTKPLIVTQEQQLLFDELCEILKKNEIDVRIEAGRFDGGYCLVDEKKLFFLNKDHQIEHNIEILVQYLRSIELDDVYLSPKLRSILEESEFKFEESK